MSITFDRHCNVYLLPGALTHPVACALQRAGFYLFPQYFAQHGGHCQTFTYAVHKGHRLLCFVELLGHVASRHHFGGVPILYGTDPAKLTEMVKKVCKGL